MKAVVKSENGAGIDEIFSDAGLLREWITKRFGQILTHGGSYPAYWRAIRNCKQLARMTGLSLDAVIFQVVGDHEHASNHEDFDI